MTTERLIGLQVEHLTIKGSAGAILRDISVAFRAGEMVALIGPSGAGKSTLLRTLGLRPPRRKNDYGVVSMVEDGKATRIAGKNHQELLEVISYVPQEDLFPEEATVAEVLEDALCFAGGSAGAGEILAMVDLAENCLGQRVASLSGGQRRRLSVARALCSRPRILLLDEPTSGLDLPVAHGVMSLLRDLSRREKLTVITTSHQPETLAVCDRVLVMAKGGTLRGDYRNFEEVFREKEIAKIFARNTEIEKIADFEYLESESVGDDRWETRHFERVFQRSLRKAWRGRSAVWVGVGLPVILAGLIVLTQSLHGMQGPSFINFFLTVAAMWIGMSVSIREVVGERALYAIDELSGLGNASYFLGKLGSAGVLVVVSTVFLCVAAWVFVSLLEVDQNEVRDSSWFDARDFVSHLMVLGLVNFSGVVLGFILSSVARSEQGAIGLMPMVLLPHVLLSKYATGYAGEAVGAAVSHPFHSLDGAGGDFAGFSDFSIVEWVNFLGGIFTSTRHGVAIFDQLGSSRFSFGEIFGLDFLALVVLISGQLGFAYWIFSRSANLAIRTLK